MTLTIEYQNGVKRVVRLSDGFKISRNGQSRKKQHELLADTKDLVYQISKGNHYKTFKLIK